MPRADPADVCFALACAIREPPYKFKRDHATDLVIHDAAESLLQALEARGFEVHRRPVRPREGIEHRSRSDVTGMPPRTTKREGSSGMMSDLVRMPALAQVLLLRLQLIE
jgi:hypothetical protein